MAKIAIDCDGVLANFITAFVEEANKMWPGKVPDPKTYWSTRHHQWGFDPEVLTEAEVDAVWARINATPNWWCTLSAHTDNVGALAVWLHMHSDNEVWIVTSRALTAGMTVSQQTELWLRACGVEWPHNYVGVIPVPRSDGKASIYKHMGIEWSIDDKQETVLQCQQLRGHNAYVLDRPWNAVANIRYRVRTVGDFLKEVCP